MNRIRNKFYDAFHGIWTGLHHRSIAVQFVLAAMAVAAGLIMRLNMREWIAVVLCIGMVISAEMLNTCIEKLCDLHSKEFDERIRTIKDIAAGAVLIVSLTALFTALVILFLHIGGKSL